MKKWIFWIFLILLLIMNLYGNKTYALEGLLKPDSMTVDNHTLFVVDGARVFSYSLKDFGLQRIFGKKGEGPGELSSVPFWSNQITLHQGNLFIEGLSKYMLVKKNGQLLHERKKAKRFLKMLPVGDNYVVRTFPFRHSDQKFYEIIKTVNAQMEDIQELYQLDTTTLNRNGNHFPIIPDSVNFSVYKGKIYIEDSLKGFLIRVFDSRGKELYQIKKDVPRIKVTQEIIQREMAHIKESFKQRRLSVTVPIHIGEGGWEKFKKWANFATARYLPAIKDILVKEDRIYLQTYQKKGDKDGYMILDLEGNLLKQIFLPQLKSFALYDSYMLGAGVKFYNFIGNSFIYLEEDEENEEWKICQVQF